MLLISEGHCAATGTVAIVGERQATPHWPVMVTLASKPVPVPVLVPAKVGSTIRLVGPAPHPVCVQHLGTEMDALRNKASMNAFVQGFDERVCSCPSSADISIAW